MDLSVCVAPLAIVPSWVLGSLDLETACPSRSCRFELLFSVPASGHQPFWCRTPSRNKCCRRLTSRSFEKEAWLAMQVRLNKSSHCTFLHSVPCSPVWLRNIQFSKAFSGLQEQGVSLVAAKWFFPALNGLLIVLIQEQADSEGVKFEVSLNGGNVRQSQYADMIAVRQWCSDPKGQISSQSWELRSAASLRRTCAAVSSTVLTPNAFGCGMGTHCIGSGPPVNISIAHVFQGRPILEFGAISRDKFLWFRKYKKPWRFHRASTHGQDRRPHGRVATPSTNQPYSTEDGGGVQSEVVEV